MSEKIFVAGSGVQASDGLSVVTGQALRDVIAHRLAQIEIHGYDREHDAGETTDNLLAAAESYLTKAAVKLQTPTELADAQPLIWPWEASAWKPGPPRRMLVKAAALILAAIDRIDAEPLPDQRHPAADGASPDRDPGDASPQAGEAR